MFLVKTSASVGAIARESLWRWVSTCGLSRSSDHCGPVRQGRSKGSILDLYDSYQCWHALLVSRGGVFFFIFALASRSCMLFVRLLTFSAFYGAPCGAVYYTFGCISSVQRDVSSRITGAGKHRAFFASSFSFSPRVPPSMRGHLDLLYIARTVQAVRFPRQRSSRSRCMFVFRFDESGRLR